MSFNFVVTNMQTLIDAFATLGLADADQRADATFSPEIFCVTEDSNVSIHSAIGLQLWPPFFDHYFCSELQYSWFFFNEILSLAQDLQDSGYISFSFSIGRNPDLAQIQFQGPNGLLHTIFLELGYFNPPLRIHEFFIMCLDNLELSRYSVQINIKSGQLFRAITQEEEEEIPRNPYFCRCPSELCREGGHCGCVLRQIPCNRRCTGCGRYCLNPWGRVDDM